MIRPPSLIVSTSLGGSVSTPLVCFMSLSSGPRTPRNLTFSLDPRYSYSQLILQCSASTVKTQLDDAQSVLATQYGVQEKMLDHQKRSKESEPISDLMGAIFFASGSISSVFLRARISCV